MATTRVSPKATRVAALWTLFKLCLAFQRKTFFTVLLSLLLLVMRRRLLLYRCYQVGLAFKTVWWKKTWMKVVWFQICTQGFVRTLSTKAVMYQAWTQRRVRYSRTFCKRTPLGPYSNVRLGEVSAYGRLKLQRCYVAGTWVLSVRLREVSAFVKCPIAEIWLFIKNCILLFRFNAVKTVWRASKAEKKVTYSDNENTFDLYQREVCKTGVYCPVISSHWSVWYRYQTWKMYL